MTLKTHITSLTPYRAFSVKGKWVVDTDQVLTNADCHSGITLAKEVIWCRFFSFLHLFSGRKKKHTCYIALNLAFNSFEFMFADGFQTER